MDAESTPVPATPPRSTPIMKFFAYGHLPPRLQEVSRPIGELAIQMDDALPDGPEKSAGLRKLLEAKDCFVRAILSVLVAALLCMASPAQPPTLSHTSVTCQQALTTASETVVSSNATFTSDTFFSWFALSAVFGPFASYSATVTGFAVLTVADQGCSSAFPLGPSCPSLSNIYPMGSSIGDSNVIAIEFLTMSASNAQWTHTTTVPVASLPPSSAPLTWVVQHVFWQTDPSASECWFAAGNAVRFSGSQ